MRQPFWNWRQRWQRLWWRRLPNQRWSAIRERWKLALLRVHTAICERMLLRRVHWAAILERWLLRRVHWAAMCERWKLRLQCKLRLLQLRLLRVISNAKSRRIARQESP